MVPKRRPQTLAVNRLPLAVLQSAPQHRKKKVDRVKAAEQDNGQDLAGSFFFVVEKTGVPEDEKETLRLVLMAARLSNDPSPHTTGPNNPAHTDMS